MLRRLPKCESKRVLVFRNRGDSSSGRWKIIFRKGTWRVAESTLTNPSAEADVNFGQTGLSQEVWKLIDNESLPPTNRARTDDD